jgi:hypothetical protein
MRFVLKHLFLILLVLGVGGLVALQVWQNRQEKARAEDPTPKPNLSIMITRQSGTDLLHLFVQNLNPQDGALISQEVFTLERLGEGASIAHYTSSSPNFLSPAAIAQKRPDGTSLTAEQQSALQIWMRGQLETRLRQLDTALKRRTSLGVFTALRIVHDAQPRSSDQAAAIRPWVALPAIQSAGNDSKSKTESFDLQLQLTLDGTAYENLETFAKRLADEFHQRSSTRK